MRLKLSYSVTIYVIVLFIIACISFHTASFQAHTSGLLLYLLLIVIVLYFFLSRYSCRLEIDEDSVMQIRYLMPWNKNRTIDLKNYGYVDYGRGFYGSLTERRNGMKNLLRYPYDTIVLSEKPDFKEQTVILRVNLSIGHFNKLLTYLEQTEGLTLANSNGAGGYFW